MATKLTQQEKQIAARLGISEAEYIATATHNASRATQPSKDDDDALVNNPTDAQLARSLGVSVEALQATRASNEREFRIVRAAVDAPPADGDAPPGDAPATPCAKCAQHAEMVAKCHPLMNNAVAMLAEVADGLHQMAGGDPGEFLGGVAAARRTLLTRA